MADNTAVDLAQVEAETHDEIDDIMAEIEKIKAGISTGEPPAVETPAAEALPPAEAAPAQPIAEVTEVDFGTANTEAPMEEMLAASGVEEAANGGALSEPATAEEITVAEEGGEGGGQTPEEGAVAEEGGGQTPEEGAVAEEGGGQTPEVPLVTPEVVAAAAAAEAPVFVPKLVVAPVPAAPVSAAAPSPVSPSRGEASTLQSVVTPLPAPMPVAQLARAQGEGSLSMTLAGSMRLALKYEQEGQEVSIRFEDEFLKISMADGTEFKIPVGRARRNAA